MAFTKIATVNEVPSGQAKKVAIGNRQIALFNVEGTFYAIDNTCTHRGGPLAEGELEGKEVTCPWHGARFDVTTGSHLSPPAPRDVTAYTVQVVGEEVQVDV